MPCSSSPRPALGEAERVERAQLGLLRADRPRLLERVQRRVARLAVLVAQHQHARAGLEHVRALGARLGREQRERAVEGGEGLVADAGGAQEVAEPLVERGGADRVGALVELGERLADQRDRAALLAARVRAGGGVAQDLGAVHAGALLRVRDARPQLERALVVAARLLVGVDALGQHAGLDARGQRAPELVRGAPVARELCGVRRGRAGRPAAQGAPRAPVRCAGAARCPRPGAGRRGSPRRPARGGRSRCRRRPRPAPGGRRPRARPP